MKNTKVDNPGAKIVTILFSHRGFFTIIAVIALVIALPIIVVLAQYRQSATSNTPPPASVQGLHISGNQLLNAAGQPVILRGVNRSSFEYFCLNNWGYFFHGPVDATAVQAIASWHVNAVRIPINSNCMLNINGVPSQNAGANYLAALQDFVSLLNKANIAAVLDLHWDNSGSTLANSQTPMPGQDHAPAFWTMVANAFKNNSSVIFDLFNEPYPDNNQDTTAAWTCWRDGGSCSGVNYQAAGMQELVKTVRATGATNVIMLEGTAYAAHISRWLQYKPADPLNNLMASIHIYPGLSQCASSSCWDSEIAPVAQQVPVMAGEIGERDCAHSLVDPLMNWFDGHNIGYTGWSWIVSGCASEPSLISDYKGTPTPFGVGLQTHLAHVQGGINPTPTPTPSPKHTSTPTPSPKYTSTPTPGQTATPILPQSTGGNLTLYDNAVAPSFRDYSYGFSSRNACDTTTFVSSPCSYQIAYQGNGGIFWRVANGSLDTAGYTSLQYDFNPGGQPLADFKVYLSSDSKGLGTVVLSSANVVGTLSNGWVRIAIPMSQLNPSNSPLQNIEIKNATNNALSSVYLDDVIMLAS